MAVMGDPYDTAQRISPADFENNRKKIASEKLQAEYSLARQKFLHEEKPKEEKKQTLLLKIKERISKRPGPRGALRFRTNKTKPALNYQQRQSIYKSFLRQRSQTQIRKAMPVRRDEEIKGKPISNLDKNKVNEIFLQQKLNSLNADKIKSSSLSENTKKMLLRLIFVQNKSKRDDFEMQRRIAERKIISNAGNLLRTPNVFQDPPGRLNEWLEIPEFNPLRAGNIFKENPNNPHITKTNRLNILQTREAGNNLSLFGDSSLKTDKIKSKKPINTRLSFWKS